MRVKKLFLQLVGIFCAVLTVFTLSACNSDTQDGDGTDNKPAAPTALSAPVITLADNVISWQAVDNADSYEIYENGESVKTQTQTSYTVTRTVVGAYVYKVKALSSDTAYTASPFSNEETYIVEEIKPDGSKEHPFEITYLNEYSHETEDGDDEIYYTYSVGEKAETLYFSWSKGTDIRVIGGDVDVSSTNADDEAEWPDGFTFPAGTVVTVIIQSADSVPGLLSFVISNKPLSVIEDGTQEFPFTLETGEITVTVLKGGETYYVLYAKEGTTFTLKSASTNISLKIYNSTDGIESATAYTSDTNGLNCTVNLGALSYTYFVFSAKDGNADKFTLSVAEGQNEDNTGGSETNPKKITQFKEYNDVIEDAFGAVYYTYTTGAQAEKLYFSWSEGTSINVTYISGLIESNRSSKDKDDIVLLHNGILFPANTTITIIVGSADGTLNLSFTISNSASENATGAQN